MLIISFSEVLSGHWTHESHSYLTAGPCIGHGFKVDKILRSFMSEEFLKSKYFAIGTDIEKEK